MTKISPLAHVHPKAKIGKDVQIDAFAFVDEDVVIGDGSWLATNSIAYAGTEIGNKCKIYPGAVIGADPQDLKYSGEKTKAIIGNNVLIREYVTINKGTKAYGKTIVGDNTLLMAYVHVAHDCHVMDNCIIANAVNLAGHVILGSHVSIGGMTAIQQFVNIGAHTYITGGSLVRKNVPPYVKAAREPLSYVGINRIGLERRGFTPEAINRIQDIYRVLFIKGWSMSKALDHIEKAVPGSPEKKHILDFINKSEKGLMRGFNSLIGD